MVKCLPKQSFNRRMESNASNNLQEELILLNAMKKTMKNRRMDIKKKRKPNERAIVSTEEYRSELENKKVTKRKDEYA